VCLLKLSSAYFIFVTLLSLALISTAGAVQLTPDTVVRLEVKDGDAYRGLEFVSSAGYGAGMSLDYDIIKLECLYSAYEGSSDSDIVRARGVYKLAYTYQDRPYYLHCGVRGELFFGHNDFERNELYFGLDHDFRQLGSLRLSWDVSVDPGSSSALYSSILAGKTLGLLSNLDLDLGFGLGFGDENFAISQLELVSSEESFSRRWYDAHVSASFVIMTFWCDLMPYVRYSTVLESSAREFISAENGSADSWTSGLVLSVYWD